MFWNLADNVQYILFYENFAKVGSSSAFVQFASILQVQWVEIATRSQKNYFDRYFVKNCAFQKLSSKEQKNNNFVESLFRHKKFLNTNASNAGILEQSMGVRNRVE